MVRAPQPDGMIDESRWKLPEVRDERVTECAGRILEPRKFQPIEPQAAAILANVGIDATDPQLA